MKLPQPNQNTDFTPPPAGTHLGVCYRFIDLGTQEIDWQGTKKHQHKVLIGWELPEELMEDGRPFTIHQKYTWSMSDKAKLRADLESWRGRSFEDSDFGPGGFDIKNILGKTCVLTVVHDTKNGKTYANVAAVGKPMKNMASPTPQNPVVYLSLEEFAPDVFASLSNGLQEQIKKSPEYQALTNGNHGDSHDALPEMNDDIPF